MVTSDLIEFFSENYPRITETQRIWSKAGGKVGQILDSESGQERWHDLLRRADSGAIPMFQLIGLALQEYPGNLTLRHALVKYVSPIDQLKTSQLIEAFINNDVVTKAQSLNQLASLPALHAQIALTTSLDRVLKESPQKVETFLEKVKSTLAEEGAKTSIEFLKSSVEWGVRALALSVGIS